jgi:Flp pilus assembly pilin Flp
MTTIESVLRTIARRIGLLCERGASLVEYTLLVALVAIAAIIGMSLLGDSSQAKLTEVGCEIDDTQPGC